MYAIVDQHGNIELLADTVSAAVREGERLGFDVVVDVTAPPEQVAIAANPAKSMSEIAWNNIGNLRMPMDDVMSISVKEAWQTLIHFVPKLAKARHHREAGEVTGNWATREGMIDSLLSGNYKTDKKFPFGEVHVLGLMLLPARQWQNKTGVKADLCVGSNSECRAGCLVYSGRNTLDPYNEMLKKAKTSMMLAAPAAFGRMLLEACKAHRGLGKKKKSIPMVRLNVYSDVPWELVFPELFDELNDLQFYDYTKVAGREIPRNYNLTFSYSGTNEMLMRSEIKRGRNAAVVFLNTQKHADSSAPEFSARRAGLPEEFLGYEVINGDSSDVRPFDDQLGRGPAPYIVGLTWKAPKKQGKVENRRFAIPVEDLDGRIVATITPRQEPDTDADSDTAEAGAVEAELVQLRRPSAVANPTAKRRLMR